ncbi:MAG: CocE/NonD family hydrolase C-terminal non-catalytic domain-containing protein [Verrucomicrobiota bacterium]
MAYTNRAEIDRKLLTYTTPPLAETIEVTGTPVLRLHVASTATDAAFHAYLEDVAPDLPTGPPSAQTISTALMFGADRSAPAR